MKGHKVWLKPKALWAYTQARWKTCCCGIFCSRFHPILSPLKIILEMVFWTNLMLDLICTWLEKTRRFCRQVNKKISSCFWTASTCVQRSSLEWCSRLTYNGNRGLDSRTPTPNESVSCNPLHSLAQTYIHIDYTQVKWAKNSGKISLLTSYRIFWYPQIRYKVNSILWRVYFQKGLNPLFIGIALRKSPFF